MRLCQLSKDMLGVLGAEEVCVKEDEKVKKHFKDGQHEQGSTAAVFKPSLEEFSTWFFFKDATLNCSKGEKERREETEEVKNVRESHIGHLQ